MQAAFDLEAQIVSLTANEQFIHDRAMSRARDYHLTESLMVQSIEEVDRLRLWEKFGETSTFSYCSNYLKMSNDVAGNFITVARASRKIPEIAKAIEEGDLSVSVARKIAPIITQENKVEVLELTRTHTKAEVEKEVARVQPEAVNKTRVKPVGPNRHKITMEVSDAMFEKLKRLQELENAKLDEALETAVDVYLDKKDPVRKADRAKVRVAKPQAAGRAPIPAAVKHAVHKRDRCCCQVRMPDGSKCGNRKWIDLHHIKKVENGGLNTAENLITVCGAHHRQLHDEREFTV